MVDVLVLTVLVGLSGGGAALLFRALPWPRRLLEHPHWFWAKLWGCAACAGLRGALLAGLMALSGEDWPGWREAAGIWLAASAIAAVIYAYVYPQAPVIDLGADDLEEL